MSRVEAVEAGSMRRRSSTCRAQQKLLTLNSVLHQQITRPDGTICHSTSASCFFTSYEPQHWQYLQAHLDPS